MREQLFHLDRNRPASLQSQLREKLVHAILDGHIPAGAPLPSCRHLAKQLGVARNTVTLAYQQLVDNGYLIARERSGYYVNQEILSGRVPAPRRQPSTGAHMPRWRQRFKVSPSTQRNIIKPDDWHRYPYPFIYGQPDPALFPVADWRECVREALSVKTLHECARDQVDSDDARLIEQIHTRLLPRRGVWAQPEEILITNGAQHALYILAQLFLGVKTRIALEEPGYPDARNIFALHTPNLCPVPVDEAGLRVDDTPARCDYVYVTPSHQSPTTVTMSLARREALLARAANSDMVIIEDDYESETNFFGEPTPALKSLDRENRVVYIGSLSKTLAPGLRLGYMVGAEPLLREARALRRLMIRHPPANNQRALALFLSLGHHDSLVQRLRHAYKARWQTMRDALANYLPDSARAPALGGTSCWVKGPASLDAAALQQAASRQGILIEAGDVQFMSADPPRNFFRLGFSSIALERIEPGIRKLARLIKQIS